MSPVVEELLQLQISPAGGGGGDSHPGNEQQAAGVGILLQIMMLVLSFVLGHVLRRHKFYYLPEASASLLIGFSLSPKPFFSNFGAIVTFALLGTFIASVVTGELGSDMNLYALVFGESVLNDADELQRTTFFRTLHEVHACGRSWPHWYSVNIVHGNCKWKFKKFNVQPLMIIGAETWKNMYFCVFQVMKHYTYSNLSENSQRFVSAFFHLISSLAETFV
ncbi:unnamed protein product [Dovyalis caffra]|uniref:Uncharacterized protein n=1 Tax=Dovyalis caffra TaxID=77055 RepID=A0AAV1QRQ2_9ROSI|nr:unnamed protein product [Dovyalis caffra]